MPPNSPLSVAYLALDRLEPDPSNARKHSAKQIRQIADSIEAFGFNTPVLVDADGNVIAGHGRLAAARRLGLAEIPVIRLEALSEPQKRAFMIADNRLAEGSAWDDRRLGEQLRVLKGIELDFDIAAIGFEMREIDLRIERLNAPKRPAAAKAAAVSRAGDRWRLSPHELACGDPPSDCDAIARRWQADTAGTARHAVSGASFDEVARRRAAEAASPSVHASSPCDETTHPRRATTVDCRAPLAMTEVSGEN